MELKVNQDNCLGCGICVIACPVNDLSALKMQVVMVQRLMK